MQALATLAAAAVVSTGALALASYPLALPWLRSYGYATEVQPNTAFALALAGVALLVCRSRAAAADAIVRAVGAVVAVIGTATLLEHVTGVDVGIDRLLVPGIGSGVGTLSPGRMGPPAASNFLVAGAALVAMTIRGGTPAAQALGVAIAAVPLGGAVGYAYGAVPLYDSPQFTAIALPTALALLALDAGLVLARPDEGFVARLAAPGSGNALARRLLVYAILLPAVLGWVAIRLAGAGSRGALAVAVLVVAVALGLVLLVFRDAVVLDRAEAARRRAQDEREASREALALALAREREARATAEAASRARDHFLSNLSHELRTPLNAILGWTGLLRDAVGDRARLERGLGVIDRNGRALAQLVSDLLDVSRLVRGELELARDPVDLAVLVATEVDAARAAAEAKGVALALAAPAPAPTTGDAARLRQIASNLVSNAVKFTPAGGRVDVRVAIEGERAILEVADTGIGLAPEYLPQLFEPFSQADRTPARRHGGVGLGLAVVRQLALGHGGTVEARSPGAGHGATFTVVLPARPVARAPHAGLAGARVLVVDDEADSREVLVQLLESWGAHASGAASASEALAALEGERPDLVLSDIAMPGQDGYALLEEVRRRERARGVPRVPAAALTAFGRPEDRSRVLAAGFDAHVPKPIDADALRATVSRLLAGPRRGPAPLAGRGVDASPALSARGSARGGGP